MSGDNHNQADCGGCSGIGAHKRWCPAVVGLTASTRGRQAEAAENLGDSVGSNNPQAANLLYTVSTMLRAQALDAAERYRIRGEVSS